jgi:2-polyprenyl-3-methyl-5-hydroxy-6-metoxy-1,4-benzoquinol methylase
MKYDPIKKGLGEVFNRSPMLRKLFYSLLDLLLLRAWHIKRELRKARRIIGTEAEVLDAGSGFGQYSWFMSRLSRGWKIKGVDVKQEQIDDCNQFFVRIGKSEISVDQNLKTET